MDESERLPDDIEITLDGRDFVMRPSFKAIFRIEEQCAMGIMDLTRRVGEQKHGLREAAIIITAGLQAAGERGAGLNKVAELVFKTGLIQVYGALDRFLWRCVTADGEPGEGEPADDGGDAPETGPEDGPGEAGAAKG